MNKILAASIAALVLVSGEASARIRGPAFDSISATCLNLQNEADRLLDEHRRLGDSGITEEEGRRMQEIRARLYQIGQAWNDVCSQFGSITGPTQVTPPIRRQPAPYLPANPGGQRVAPR